MARFNIADEQHSSEANEQSLDAALAQLSEQLKDDPALHQWLKEAIDALPAALQQEDPSPERLMEALAQLCQRQPEDPAAAQAIQQFMQLLQSHVATQPHGEPLVAGLRSLQNLRPMVQGASNLPLLSHQLAQAANGAPLGPLEALGQLTQSQPSKLSQSQLETQLKMMAVQATDSTQLTDLSNLAQLRQTQPQLQNGSLNQLPVSDNGNHEFSALSLGKHSAHWAEQMLTPLTDRLRVQSHMDIKQATLRLDPPELGRLDLQVRTEGDRVFIQISATNPMVRDQLLQLADRLRQDLMLGEAYTQVDVDIGQQGHHSGDDKPMTLHEQDLAQAIGGHEESRDEHSLSLTADSAVDLYV